VIFFAYIGFDAVSTGSEESKNPGRDLPIAVIGSLLISTVLYVIVAIAAVGVAPIATLTGSDAPLAAGLREGAASRGREGCWPWARSSPSPASCW
jgi:APA family basic amino acid/polyamine antiporter